MEKFFNPKSVAIIGASPTKGKIGEIILSNFELKQFRGRVYPINPKYKKIRKNKCYASVMDIPGKVDMAVIAVPSSPAYFVLKECVQKKIPAVVIITSGFAEIGNRKLEEAMKKAIKGTKTRVIGPNCIGVYDSSSYVDNVFLPRDKLPRPRKGGLSMISQSGAVGSILLDYLTKENLGVNKFISYGNALDLNESDLIEYLSKDPKTRVIACYIEEVRDGKRFIEVCAKSKKPIVVLKGGRSEKTAKAVSSHTGSMAGATEVYSGAFKQVGVKEADNWEEMFDIAKAYMQPVPKGKKILIITDGGGFGILATDTAAKVGLKMPLPSKKTIDKLKRLKLPEICILSNPLDLTGGATSEWLARSLDITMNSREYNAVVVIALFQVPSLGKPGADAMIKMNKKHKKAPLYAVSVGSGFAQELADDMQRAGIPVYQTPARAITTIAKILG